MSQEDEDDEDEVLVKALHSSSCASLCLSLEPSLLQGALSLLLCWSSLLVSRYTGPEDWTTLVLVYVQEDRLLDCGRLRSSVWTCS